MLRFRKKGQMVERPLEEIEIDNIEYNVTDDVDMTLYRVIESYNPIEDINLNEVANYINRLRKLITSSEFLRRQGYNIRIERRVKSLNVYKGWKYYICTIDELYINDKPIGYKLIEVTDNIDTDTIKIIKVLIVETDIINNIDELNITIGSNIDPDVKGYERYIKIDNGIIRGKISDIDNKEIEEKIINKISNHPDVVKLINENIERRNKLMSIYRNIFKIEDGKTPSECYYIAKDRYKINVDDILLIYHGIVDPENYIEALNIVNSDNFNIDEYVEPVKGSTSVYSSGDNEVYINESLYKCKYKKGSAEETASTIYVYKKFDNPPYSMVEKIVDNDTVYYKISG